MLDLRVLTHTMHECGYKLPRTDNVGRSGDWRDLYVLTDYLTFVMDRHFETQPCKAGCSECCALNPVFRVSRIEWEPLRTYLEGADPAFVEALLARNEAVYGPYADQLRQVAANWRASDFDAQNPALEGLPVGCPALVDHMCGVYDVRPLVCRAYGYMAVKLRGVESLLMCRTYGQPFIDGLKAQGLDKVPLPNFEPFARQLGSLAGPDAEIKPLPLWLLEWAGERRERFGAAP